MKKNSEEVTTRFWGFASSARMRSASSTPFTAGIAITISMKCKQGEEVMRRNGCYNCVQGETGRCLELNIVLRLDDYQVDRDCSHHFLETKKMVRIGPNHSDDGYYDVKCNK